MKIIRFFLVAIALSFSAKVALAEQIRGNLHMVGWAVGAVDEAVASIDVNGSNFYDWDADEYDPEVGFIANCTVPYVGWLIYVPVDNDYGKQMMAALTSANATGQTVVMAYHVGVVPESDPEVEACYIDTLSVLGVAP